MGLRIFREYRIDGQNSKKDYSLLDMIDETHARYKKDDNNTIGVLRKTFELLSLNNESGESQRVLNAKENHSKMNVIQIKICEIYLQGKYTFQVYVNDVSTVVTCGLLRIQKLF